MSPALSVHYCCARRTHLSQSSSTWATFKTAEVMSGYYIRFSQWIHSNHLAESLQLKETKIDTYGFQVIKSECWRRKLTANGSNIRSFEELWESGTSDSTEIALWRKWHHSSVHYMHEIARTGTGKEIEGKKEIGRNSSSLVTGHCHQLIFSVTTSASWRGWMIMCVCVICLWGKKDKIKYIVTCDHFYIVWDQNKVKTVLNVKEQKNKNQAGRLMRKKKKTWLQKDKSLQEKLLSFQQHVIVNCRWRELIKLVVWGDLPRTINNAKECRNIQNTAYRNIQSLFLVFF